MDRTVTHPAELLHTSLTSVLLKKKKKKTSAQNNSEFSSTAGSELVVGDELRRLRLLPQEHITIIHKFSSEMTHTFSCMSSDADTLNQFDINEFSKQG